MNAWCRCFQCARVSSTSAATSSSSPSVPGWRSRRTHLRRYAHWNNKMCVTNQHTHTHRVNHEYGKGRSPFRPVVNKSVLLKVTCTRCTCTWAACIIPPIMPQWPLCNILCVCVCVCVSLCRWVPSGSVLTCPISSVSTTTRFPPSVTTVAPCCGASWGRACSAKVSSSAVGNSWCQRGWVHLEVPNQYVHICVK